MEMANLICNVDAQLIKQYFVCCTNTCSVSINEAFKAYQELCGQYNKDCKDISSFSKLLREIYPNLQSKRQKTNSGSSKTTFFTNLEVKWKDIKDINKENVCQQPASKFIQQPDCLTDLKSVSSYFMLLNLSNKWIMSGKGVDHLSFTHLDGTLIDNIPVSRVVIVNKDLTWHIKIHGLHVPNKVISGVPTYLTLASDLKVLLDSAETNAMCEGCRNPNNISVSNSTSTIFQSVRANVGENAEAVRRSTNCEGLIHKASKSKKCPWCLHLSKALNKYSQAKSKTQPNYNTQTSDTNTRGKDKVSSRNVNWRFLGENEKRLRYDNEQKRRRNAERREIYIKKKTENQKALLQLTKSDTDDVKFMFNELDKGVDIDDNELTFDNSTSSNDDAFFWKMQRDITKSGKPLWHPRFLEVCLRLWQRSKEGYDEISKSGFIKLPSGRYLRKIKNKVMQTPGITKDHLDWMSKQAIKERTTEAGHHGYLMFDEMSIQGDLQLRKIGDTFELCGLVRIGDVQEKTKSLSTPGGNVQAEMATHILQFTFVGIEGFEFPVAYYPTAQVDPITLYHLYWEIVCALQEKKFYVHLGVCDGAQANRAFVLLHFDNEKAAVDERFTTINPYSGGPHTFMMDSSHNFKKIRNNLEKSSDSGKTPRHFNFEEGEILWKHWVDAYHYDNVTNSLSTFRRLSDDHFYLNSASRMRNYLADDVLGQEMVQVIQNYKDHLELKTKSVVKAFDKTLELLTITSTLLKNFKSKAPYRSLDDSRFTENSSCLQWFDDWKQWVENKKKTTKSGEKNISKMFISPKLQFDLSSMILGFRVYCETVFSLFPGCEIRVNHTNQDNLEQFFGRQRAQNGQNNNPTELQYGSGINGILRMSKLSISGGNSYQK